MNAILLSLAIFCTPMFSFSQSNGMHVLKNRFKGESNVHHFHIDGLLAKAAFKLAGDYEYKDAIKEVKSIEFITIPQEVFQSQHVTVKGYKNFLIENNFSELIEVKDNGELVTIYIAPNTGKHERYLIVVDGRSEVVVIEMKGYIDTSKLAPSKINSASL
jgi:Domain of unknown function (DUF4252)